MKYNKKKYQTPQLDVVRLMSNVSLMENSGETEEGLGKENTIDLEEDDSNGFWGDHKANDLWAEDK